MSVCAVAHKYGRNEYSTHAIKVHENEVHGGVAVSAFLATKVTSQVQDMALVKTKKALNLWLEDKNQKHVAMDGSFSCHKSLSLCDHCKLSTTVGNQQGI